MDRVLVHRSRFCIEPALSLVPEARPPPNGCWPTTAPVGLSLRGAGTVVTLDQCKQALECGAKFIVSPGFDPKAVSWCAERSVPITPGCVTPTEIMAAIRLGVHVVKFFPAGVYGGLNAMKALSAPFGGVKFIPTGGVDAKNLKDYLEAPFVHAVGGSWLCPKKEIAAGKFDAVTALCREASQIVREVRG